MTQIFITKQFYVKGEVVPVHDIKLGIRCRCTSHILPMRKESPALTKHQAGWASNVPWRRYPHR